MTQRWLAMLVIESILKRAPIRPNGPRFGHPWSSKRESSIHEVLLETEEPLTIGCDGDCVMKVGVCATATYQFIVHVLLSKLRIDFMNKRIGDTVSSSEDRNAVRGSNPDKMTTAAAIGFCFME